MASWLTSPVRVLAACLAGTAVLAAPAPVQAATPEAPLPPPAPWLEATPLDDQEPARVFVPGAEPEAVELPAGRWMLCAGGAGGGVTCELRQLDHPQEVTPETAQGVAVTGTVFVGRYPAAEARVAVVPAGLASRRRFTVPLERETASGDLVRQVTCDEQGRFHLPPLAPGDYLLAIHLAGGRLLHGDPFSLPAPETLRHAADEAAPPSPTWELGELRFDAGTEIEVLVTGADGLPVAGARVGGGQDEPRGPTVFFETEADETGKAVLSGLDPAQPMSVVCVAEGHRRWRRVFEVPPPWVSCELEALAALAGRVLDEAEEPVAGATVRLSGTERRVRSGEDGAFTLELLVAGRHRLEIAASGFQPTTLEAALAPGERLELPPVLLAPGELLRGIVKDGGTGEPVAGAAVTITEPAGGGGAVSDEAGEIELVTGLDRSLVLEISAAGYPLTRRRLEAAPERGEEPVELELYPGGRIEVLAWDETGAGPCVGCAFAVSGPQEGWKRLRTNTEGRAVSELLTAGTYQVHEVGERSLGSVVEVRGGREVRSAEVRPRETAVVRFGEPRERLRVRLRPAPPPGWTLSARGAGRATVPQPLPDGSFELLRRPGEAIRLALRNSAGAWVSQAEIPPAFDRDRLDLPLPNTRVTGILLQAESPLAGVEVRLLDLAGGTPRAAAVTNAAGEFELSFLHPGTYAVTFDGRTLRTVSLAPGQPKDLGKIAVEQTAALRSDSGLVP